MTDMPATAVAAAGGATLRPRTERTAQYAAVTAAMGPVVWLAANVLSTTTKPMAVWAAITIVELQAANLASIFLRLRCRFVRADATGLAWNLGSGRMHVPWSDVRDYFYRSEALGNDRSVADMVLLAGRTEVEVPRHYAGDNGAFRQVVERHAAHAPGRGWKSAPLRPLAGRALTFAGSEDGERARSRTTLAIGCAVASGVFLVVLAAKIRSIDPHFATEPLSGRLGLLFVVLLGASVPPFVGYVYWQSEIAPRFQRLGGRIALDEEGITQDGGGGEAIKLRWDEVTDYFVRTGPASVSAPLERSVIVGPAGRQLDFVCGAGSMSAARLRALVTLYAVRAGTHGEPGPWRRG